MHRFRSWTSDPPEWRTQRNRSLPIEGGDGSTLSVDFSSEVLDPAFTFSATTNATFINNEGYLQNRKQNLLYNTEWNTTSIPTGWLKNASSTGDPTYNGNGTITFSATNARQFIYPNFPYITTTPGLPYTASITVFAASGSPIFGEVFVEGGANGTMSEIVLYINGSTQKNGSPVTASTTIEAGETLSISLKNTSTQWYPRFGIGVNGNVTGTKSVSLTQPQANIGTIPQPYIINTNTATGYFAPRFDYNPTSLSFRGLLLEAPATNKLTWSETFSTSGGANQWVNQRGQVVTGQTTGPDNILNSACRLEAIASTSGTHNIYQSSVVKAASEVSTFSLFVKANTTQYIKLQIETGGGTNFAAATFTLTGNGSSVSSTGGTGFSNVLPEIIQYKNGWYRVALTATTDSNTACAALIRINNASNQESYTTSATPESLFIFGAQYEGNPPASAPYNSVTSYIPTGSSTVLKLGDSLLSTGTGLSRWFLNSYAEGTFLFKGSVTNTPSGYTRLFCLTQSSNILTATGTVPAINAGVAASNNNQLFLNAFVAANNNVDIYVPIGAAVTNKTEFAFALTYKAGDWRISSKNLAATSTYASVGTTWGTNLFMNNVNGVPMPQVWYNRFKFVPRRLSNSEMDIWS